MTHFLVRKDVRTLGWIFATFQGEVVECLLREVGTRNGQLIGQIKVAFDWLDRLRQKGLIEIVWVDGIEETVEAELRLISGLKSRFTNFWFYESL